MNEQEKHLLILDLCARLPYGVIGHYYLNKSIEWGEPERLLNIDLLEERLITEESDYCIEEFIPYLRPLSSMTEEEFHEIYKFLCRTMDSKYCVPLFQERYYKDIPHWRNDWSVCNLKVIDYLLKHHFDFRNLIEKGLAIAVTPENNPYK